jgi:uncharacterized protein (UPF0333 family)
LNLWAGQSSSSGQIVIEYALLLVIAISLAAIFTKFMIGRTEGSEGVIIKVWTELSDQIGNDLPDDPAPPK